MSKSADTRTKPPVLVTMGEPAGIGPEVAVAAFHHFNGTIGGRAIKLVGDTSVFRACGDVPDDAIIATKNSARREPAKPRTKNSEAVCEAIRFAVDEATARRAGAVVTAPINKAVLAGAGFKFPGHTEFLEHLTQVPRAVMIHLPLEKVPAAISEKAVVETGEIILAALKDDFGIAKPRLAVAGLNPHAGEKGVLGDQEIRSIAPAVAQLRAEGAAVLGPLPADTMFHPEARKKYDAALCMYHDQALVPLKMLAFWEGVNVTLGLPIVRTSPDHGTAFEIAGTGKADARSMIAAIAMAAEIADARGR
jgi:4-hydroxythreonine-4-phosphate dehydrogenase